MADGSLIFDTRVDTRGFNKGARNIQTLADTLCGNVAASFKRIGAVVASVFAVRQLVQFGSSAISLASDLQEVQNVVDTAFGSMAYKMEEFADTCIENYGMSKLTAKEMGSTFMAMAKGMGQATDIASDKAVELTGRLGDIMSFYNKTASEANTIGRAIYSGETEPLKQIGIIMTETNLETYALAKGYGKLYKEMSAAEKLLVRQEYFLEQTAMAAGDFVKTQDSWANQTRILSEQWKEFMTICGNGLMQVLAPTVKTLNYMVASLIDVAEAASKVFGISVSSNMSEEAEKAQKEMEALKADIKETEKVAKGGAASFDELELIGSKETGTETSGGSAAEEREEEKEATEDAEEAVGLLELALLNLKAAVQPTVEALNSLWTGGFSELAAFSWTGLQSFYNEVLVPLGQWTLGDGIPAFVEILNDGLTNTDWELLNTALLNLWQSVEPFAETVGEGLLWFWENILVPLGAYVVNDAALLFLDGLVVVLDLMSAGIGVLQPMFLWLWENMLQPIAEWTGGIIVTVLGDIITAFGAVSEWISNNQEPVAIMTVTVAAFFAAWKAIEIVSFIQQTGGLLAALSAIMAGLKAVTVAKLVDKAETMILTAMYAKDFVVSLAKGTAALVKQGIQLGIATAAKVADTVAQTAMTAATIAWNAVCAAATTLMTAFSAAVAFLTSPIGLVVIAIGALIAAGVLLYKNWDKVKEFAKKTWKSVVESFTSMKNAVCNIFSGIWDGIKGIINKILGGIEKMANGVVKAVNKIIDSMNGLSFDVPDWVPGLGGKTFGFNIPNLREVSIPRLATGTVVPANYGEFAAILGDNKRETEVVSPLSTMKQALKEALEELGGLGEGEINIILELDGDVVYRKMVKRNQMHKRQTGKSAFE